MSTASNPKGRAQERRCAPKAVAADTAGAFNPGVEELENEGAYAVMAAASALEKKTGKSVVHLEIGQPGFPTPAYICKAANAAIAAGDTKYGPPAGSTALRECIAEWTKARTSVRIDPKQVVVGPGAKPGLFFSTIALIRGKQDEVIIPDPGFPTYAAMVSVAGGTTVSVRLAPDMRTYDMKALEAAVGPSTRLLVINSPSNPCGGVAAKEDLEKIAELAKKYDFYVLSDEIYGQLTYTDQYTSILSLPGMVDRTIVVDGFSKSWSMTGWRLGWSVMPLSLAERVELLMVHSVGCTASFVQAAGVVAIQGSTEDIQQMRDEYRRRRDLVVAGLNSIKGVTCATPEGAFYAWADISRFGLSSKEIASRLLQEGLVAVLPGTDFGKGGEGYMRLSYGTLSRSHVVYRRALSYTRQASI